MTTMPEPHLEASEEASVVVVCRFCPKDAHSKGRNPRQVKNMTDENKAVLTAWSEQRGHLKGVDVEHYCNWCSRTLADLKKGGVGSAVAPGKPKSGVNLAAKSVEFSVASDGCCCCRTAEQHGERAPDQSWGGGHDGPHRAGLGHEGGRGGRRALEWP